MYKIVAQEDRAETAAQYLAETHWGDTKPTRHTKYSKQKIVYSNPVLSYNVDQISLTELNEILNKLKRQKRQVRTKYQ